ncbi:MAG: arginine--tRNA ligase [Deltaproteobacteria bacterium]|nr:arginine--tRNA ligase [Deltaproteobacteria bacterium]
MLEAHIRQLFIESVAACQRSAGWPTDLSVPAFELETPKQAAHGDFATNLAMVLARTLRQPPRQVAETLIKHLPPDAAIAQAVVAGPGFINCTLAPDWLFAQLAHVVQAGPRFGTSPTHAGERCLVEFVSANPTGPLHVGHGRGAIYGDVLGNVLRAVGYDVIKEYYLNDTGVQIRTLGRSVWLRLRELQGEAIEFPSDAYQGSYITDLARQIIAAGEWPTLSAMTDADRLAWCGQYAGAAILRGIQADLAACGVVLDHYFSETTLHQTGAVEKTLQTLRDAGHVFEHEGALWFRSTAFGDDKDRVVRKSDGQYTYFAADIAYHAEKCARGFARMVDVWGADHAGHVTRMHAAVQALGFDPQRLDCVLLQLVNLLRDGALVSMSTRSGEFETLRDLVDVVGCDVTRYFYLMRSHQAQLDFDLKLATARTLDNPVYYLQYAHARIASIFTKAAESGLTWDPTVVPTAAGLTLPEEVQLARTVAEYPRLVRLAAAELEPHRVPFYLLDLARQFQSYYSNGKKDPRYRVLGQPPAVGAAKLYLLKAIQTVLQNGLTLLGVSAPERMDRTEVLEG